MNPRLRIINAMLRIIGESAVDSLDTAHPDVVSAAEVLDSNKEEILGQGWWFNKFTVTLTRDINGIIHVPANTMSLDSTNPSHNYTIRDGKLFDMGNQTYIFTENQEVEIIFDLPEEEIPPVALSNVKHTAVVEFAAVNQVTGNAVNVAMEKQAKSEERLNALRFRNADVNYSDNMMNRNMQRFRNHFSTTRKSGFYGSYTSKLKKM